MMGAARCLRSMHSAWRAERSLFTACPQHRAAAHGPSHGVMPLLGRKGCTPEALPPPEGLTTATQVASQLIYGIAHQALPLQSSFIWLRRQSLV